MNLAIRSLVPVRTARQFGALPFRARGSTIEVLLVTSRSSGKWIVPKGWPVPGRTPGESAAIEAYEEAGVRGSVAPTPLGSIAHRKGLTGRRFRIEIFALEVTEELDRWPEQHQRRRQWFVPHDAAAAVSGRDLGRLILRLAAERA